MEDVESVLQWLTNHHHCSTPEKISLMGWSQGALVAQLAAQ
jgi:alpha/beta superfamily hydrolase